MSHLHIPDGVLPPILWAPGLALALALLLFAARAGRGDPRRVAWQGALGGLMLAVMCIPMPIFGFEYCITIAGPAGVLLGASAGFQVAVVVCVILALLGHGGLTVVGLNALVLGAGIAVARPLYLRLAAGRGAAPALALATGMAQAVSGAAWFALLALAMRVSPGLAGGIGPARAGLFAGVTLALWVVAIAVESVIAFGIGRFLARVRPDLLPAAATRTADARGPDLVGTAR